MAHPPSVLRALAVVLDLANGLGRDKSARTASFAWRLAREGALGESDQRAAWHAALLRHLGCTAFASVEAELADDDIALRGALMRADGAVDQMRALVTANPGNAGRALRAAARAGVGGGALRERWTREACEAARLLAERLGLGHEVVAALDQVFERHDGRGAPRGLAGDEISTVARVANVAHAAVLGWTDGDRDGAEARLAAGSGSALDPAWVVRARALLGTLDGPDEDLPAGGELALDDVVAAFGDFADLQTPARHGHSRAVAALVDGAARAIGLGASERVVLVRAAHVHDLGEVALPTAMWLAPRALRLDERERVRLHPYLTERVLSGAEALAEVARVAGAHHERLDGTGYHRGASETGLSRAARILAAADVWCALVCDRPHRSARTAGAARDVLRGAVVDGQLDGDCVEAVLAAAGDRRAADPTVPGLTDRETEVLRGLARGLTNKEIGTALGISARTVQNHTLNIYAKLGVTTRAGAALRAAQAGLIPGPGAP